MQTVDLREFVNKTVREMIAAGEPEYRVRQFALAWMERDVLKQDDLAAIDAIYSAQADAQEA